MILNLSSLYFNLDIESHGGTPSWGTELGQGKDYKFSFEDKESFMLGMVYNAIPDTENVFCPIGKGGNQADNYDFVISSLFSKIYVNGEMVVGAQFLLLIIKKLIGEHHVGRRTLKYNPKMTYHGRRINEDCFNRMAATLGVTPNGAWFVSEINVVEQDELHFSVYVVEKEVPQKYKSLQERKEILLGLMK